MSIGFSDNGVNNGEKVLYNSVQCEFQSGDFDSIALSLPTIVQSRRQGVCYCGNDTLSHINGYKHEFDSDEGGVMQSGHNVGEKVVHNE